MALSEIDRNLLQSCLARQPRSWENFVDRFLGLVVHVVNHTAQCRSIRLNVEDREDLCAEVFLAILKNDFAALRQFRGESSLATYLTVIARRVVVRELLKRNSTATLHAPDVDLASLASNDGEDIEQRLTDRDQLDRMLEGLQGKEAEAVRMYHLEGRSYREISSHIGMPENSIGPILTRAREKLRSSIGNATQ
ncbi:MAG: sigma-70 family RNA polymerase sigma factor [Planctomycetales bacterium]|nr:sigma-70 family RNA polymerase sigma factor [Planctomycetales bacterium]